MCDCSRFVRCLAAFSLLWMTACANNGVESAAREVKTDATINDRLWQLLRFEATKADASYSITTSNYYTLILLTNGSYRVRADCNRMQGAYRFESEWRSQLSQEPRPWLNVGENHIIRTIFVSWAKCANLKSLRKLDNSN